MLRCLCDHVNLQIMNSCYRLCHCFITARSELRKVQFFGCLHSVVFLFVYEISRELLNGFVPNSHRRRVWSLARTSLMVNVKGKVTRDKKGIFRPFGGLLMFGKTSLASSLWQAIYIFILSFVLSSFFSSPNLSGRRLDVCHTSTHGVALV